MRKTSIDMLTAQRAYQIPTKLYEGLKDYTKVNEDILAKDIFYFEKSLCKLPKNNNQRKSSYIG